MKILGVVLLVIGVGAAAGALCVAAVLLTLGVAANFMALSLTTIGGLAAAIYGAALTTGKGKRSVPRVAVCPHCDRPTELRGGMGADFEFCPAHGLVEARWREVGEWAGCPDRGGA